MIYCKICGAPSAYRKKLCVDHYRQAIEEIAYGKDLTVTLWQNRPLVDRYGYIQITKDGRKQRLHRLVMEQRLGRPLDNTEQVHHINGNKLDNRLENLELWSIAHPKGSRVRDKLEFALGIIKLYDDYI